VQVSNGFQLYEARPESSLPPAFGKAMQAFKSTAEGQTSGHKWEGAGEGWVQDSGRQGAARLASRV